MNITETKNKPLMTQADYAKKLRPFLPKEAFMPDPNKIWILLINVAIVLLGWGIAANLDQWHWYALGLYLPFALIMGNSVIVFAFSTHDLMHNNAIKNPRLKQLVSLMGLTLLWMPPTLWKAVHNREHHNKTNSLDDPDRNYLYEQPKTWGKWLQNLFVPSAEVNPLLFIFGMGYIWGVYVFRHLTSVLLFNNGLTKYPCASFKVSNKERKAIALEFLTILAINITILIYLDFNPVKLILGYFLPIWLGHSGIMFYIYTNHLLCRMTSINDPLINSISVRVPKIFDILHFNFSYHTEHHIFPGLNSDYYPQVQELLKTQFEDRFNLLDALEVWRMLLATPRHYKDENTFTDWSGNKSVPCPLSREDFSLD
ncbi:MAG: fatty acid desaturase [Gomphosphaeria aponina SAG 52.96 = DSM 107014]|uniref:Fatty acid desaturase n=1 Tax=Gomphosphaeria aponina SAG 52.96 = DSM 107014 TaxID=1521640 RepID=A0A941GPD3_9CHRO|nr:fatty acid desaturase [Gomphosphaeria aponina SAG 52.96 = DSM 107014]